MKITVALAATAFLIAAATTFPYQGESFIPATGALTLPPSDEQAYLIPSPEQKQMLEVGKKTKLFMDNDAYLFGTQAYPDTAALTYRVGLGREIESASGSRWTGEVSIFASEDDEESENADSSVMQTRLSGAYLQQLNEQANFSAGLSTDLASNKSWSTLELQLSMELDDGLSLQLHHDQGKDLTSHDHEHQTALLVEKKF